MLLVTILTLTMLGGSMAFAENIHEKLTIEQATAIADKWRENNYDQEVTIKETIPVYDYDDEISAYSISFHKNEEDCGYVVINAGLNQNTFREFSLTGKDAYSRIKNTIQNMNGSVLEKKLYESDFYNYAVEISKAGKKYFAVSDGRLETNDYVQKVKTVYSKLKQYFTKKEDSLESQNYLEGIIRGDDSVFNGLGSCTSKDILGMSTIRSAVERGTYMYPYMQQDFYTNGGEGHENTGNCAPTAATHIIGYYYLGRGKSNLISNFDPFDYLFPVYDVIVNYSGFDRSYIGEKGITDIAATDAIKKYAKDKGYSNSTSKYWFNLWSDFKRDLDNNYPVFTSIKGNTVTSSGSTVKRGHAIVSIGYRIYSSGAKYLNVIDGHNEDLNRFINFDDSRFDYVNGVVVKID